MAEAKAGTQLASSAESSDTVKEMYRAFYNNIIKNQNLQVVADGTKQIYDDIWKKNSYKARRKRGATIRWRKVFGAAGYYVYRSASKNGTYKKIATVKGKTTYIGKKSLKSKKYYYYKVVTYKKYGSKVAKSKMPSYKKVKIK